MASLPTKPRSIGLARFSRFWLPFTVLSVSAITVGLLAIVKRTSEVELRVTAGSVTIPFASSPSSLFTNVSVHGIALSNFDSVTAAAGRITLGSPVGNETGRVSREKSIVSAAAFGRVYFENVVLDRIEAPEHSNVLLTWSRAAPSTLKAVFETPVGVFLRGRSVITGYCDFCGSSDMSAGRQDGAHRLTINSPGVLGQELVARASKIPAIVGFEVASPDQIDASGVSLREGDIRFESLRDGHRVSDVVSATIRFPEFKDRVMEIPRGQFIRILRGTDFLLRSIRLSDGIQLSITGKVSSFSTGDLSTMRNRVPSFLEWFDEKHSWPLYLAGVVSLTGILWGALLALKGPKENGA